MGGLGGPARGPPTHGGSPLLFRPTLRVGAACLLGPTLALAQSVTPDVPEPDAQGRADAAGEVSPAAEVAPPKVLTYGDPVYPVAERGEGRAARVVLELTVTASGTVQDVAVHESAGAAFDEAAIVAAQRTVFSPATRAGEPISARILFAVDFAVPAETGVAPVSEASAAPVPVVSGGAAPKPAAPTLRGKATTMDRSSGGETEIQPKSPPSELEVVVRGNTVARALRRSAYSVEVVELEREGQKSADLGEVLARSTSLSVQREGGLGSAARYSLNGLSGDRVRFFIDGVPLELAGFPFGVANVPVNLVDRVEVYQGVVPVRFGADALGGAVHLVTDDDVRRNRVGASYELGSFNTHRLTFGARQKLGQTGVFVKGSGFYDASDNDYPADVQVLANEETGEMADARLRRFHDGYRGQGGTLAIGVVDKPWANRFVLQGFLASYDRDVQHNSGMTVPYGEVTYGKQTSGGSVRYAKSFSERVRFETTVGYTFRRTTFEDVSHCRYDWYGRCFLVLPLSGEIDSIPTDRSIDEQAGFARSELTFRPGGSHVVRIALSPTVVRRSGEDRALAADAPDPLEADRRMTTGVLGIEYEVEPWEPVSNVAFVKGYGQVARNEDLRPTGKVEEAKSDTLTFGAGDGLRVLIAPDTYVKASYEYATRLPNADERFGDGGLVVENLELEPERSHNWNLGIFLDDAPTQMGVWRGKLSGAARLVDDLIRLSSTGTYFQYDNVLRVRVLGVDASAGWSAPGDWLGVDGRLSWQDVRNVSTSGSSAPFNGDRVPNMPYLHGGASAYLRRHGLVTARDHVELAWNVRYVHEFFLGWESAASTANKLDVPSQSVQSLALSHVQPGDDTALSTSFEVSNLTDERVFDFYGVQRPGRSFHVKMTISHQ